MFKKTFAVLLLLLSCLTGLSSGAFAAQSSSGQPVVEEASAQAVAAINLNTADVETLQAGLVGIGKVKAQAIIDHRNANGPFASVDELLEVKGIGAATLEKNRNRLTVN